MRRIQILGIILGMLFCGLLQPHLLAQETQVKYRVYYKSRYNGEVRQSRTDYETKGQAEAAAEDLRTVHAVSSAWVEEVANGTAPDGQVVPYSSEADGLMARNRQLEQRINTLARTKDKIGEMRKDLNQRDSKAYARFMDNERSGRYRWGNDVYARVRQDTQREMIRIRNERARLEQFERSYQRDIQQWLIDARQYNEMRNNAKNKADSQRSAPDEKRLEFDEFPKPKRPSLFDP